MSEPVKRDDIKKPLYVRVNTIAMATRMITKSRVMNYNLAEERQWLGKHCAWALNNGYSVQTEPVED